MDDQKKSFTVFSKQVDLLYQGLRTSLVTAAIVAFLVLYFLRTTLNSDTLMLWAMLMAGVIFYRGFSLILYLNSKKNGQPNVKKAETLFVIGSALSGLIWGSLVWWIYPLTTDTGTQLLLFVVPVGMAGGSLSTLAFRKLSITCFLGLCLLPMLVGLYRTPGQQNIAIGLAVIVYCLFLLKNAFLFQKNSEQTLILKEKALVRESKLKIARKKAEEASLSKSRFLANMSHEIRTPMNSIIGRTRLALDERLDEETEAHLNMIQSSSEDLLALINDILDFSKIEAGELKIENRPFHLHDAVESCLAAVKVLAEEKSNNLELKCTLTPDVPLTVVGDKLRLCQIMINLLNNSVKFTEKGQIHLLVERLNGTEKDHCRLQITVCDTGVGIAPDKQKLIFSEFAQEDDSLTRKFSGTGLGLAISRQLCRLMDGDIEVQSTPGKGSTFVFVLTVQVCTLEDIPVNNPVQNEISNADIASLSLLLVEDNEANRMLARMVLKKQNHQLAEAHDGLQALNILASRSFDAVLMDVQMPLMDGLTATKVIRAAEHGDEIKEVESGLSRKLRENLHGEHLPIIAMTANAMSGDREICLAAGMDNYLAKPFYPEGLTAVFIDLFPDRLVTPVAAHQPDTVCAISTESDG